MSVGLCINKENNLGLITITAASSFHQYSHFSTEHSYIQLQPYINFMNRKLYFPKLFIQLITISVDEKTFYLFA